MIGSGVGCRNLPLREYPVVAGGSKYLAILYSGDGGWAAIDKYIASALQRRGIAVVGVDCLKYLWRRKSLDRCVSDLEWLIEHYSRSWGKQRLIISGFSRGACLLPLILEKLSPQKRSAIELVVLMSLFPRIDLKFRLRDWFFNIDYKHALSVQEAIHNIADLELLCLYGEQEKDSLCWLLDTEKYGTVMLPGGHHFAHDYELVMEKIDIVIANF